MSLFNCMDCGIDTKEIHEYYMVRDEIWKAAIKDTENGMLCIRCLEERIGRLLTRDDFDFSLPINSWPSDRSAYLLLVMSR